MTNNNNIPTVSDKDTKGVIIDKFNQVVELLKAKEAAKLDPAKEVAQKAVTSTLEKAAIIVKADVGTQINEMADTVTKALTTALAEIDTRVANYKELDDAISLKRDEIKELFDIEASAYALIALINLQEEQQTTFDEHMAERKERAQAELQAVISETQERRTAFRTEIDQLRKETEVSRKREETEFIYARDRARKLDNDKWEDDKAARLKVFNTELAVQQTELDAFKADIDKRVEEVTARETAVADLQAKVDEIPSLIEAAAAKAAKDAKTSADISNGFAVRALEKAAESAKALSDMRIENLEKALASEQERVAGLETKLDEAYAKIENISGKAVDAASGASYVNRLESAYKEQTSKLSAVK